MNFEFVPSELKAIDHWVLWRREGSRKPLFQVSGEPASTTDPATWASFDATQIHSFPDWNSSGIQMGVGFVLTDHLRIVAIDIDDCVKWEEDKPVFDSWALAAINKLGDVYIEFSPSRAGLRIFVKAEIESNRRYDRAKIEFYFDKQYVTVTGDVWNNGEIAERQTEISEMIAKLDSIYRVDRNIERAKPIENSISIDERLRVAFASQSGLKLKSLFDGDMTGFEDSSEDGFDRSAADFSLCRQLCFYCDGDPGLLDQLMCRSALVRDKWELRRGSGTYLSEMIAKCISTQDKYYQPPVEIVSQGQFVGVNSRIETRFYEKKNRYSLPELTEAALAYRKRSDISGMGCGFENLNRIYRPRPGLLTVWAGKPGAGKSTFILAYLLDFALRHKIRAGICSFELNPPERIQLELVQIFSQANVFDDSMDDFEYRKNVQELGNICTIFSLGFEQRSVDGIEPLIEKEMTENGMGIFYLDPFTELQPAERLLGKYTDFASQQLSRLKELTVDKNLITHLVCHPTKQGAHRSEGITLTDINGSGDFERKADFGLVISRETGSNCTVVHQQKVRDRLTGIEDGKAAFELSPDAYYFREVPVPISLKVDKEKKDSDLPF